MVGAASAQAKTTEPVPPSQLSQCAEPTLTQAFLFTGDQNWYTLAPGQDPGRFNGEGWVLSGGASIETTTIADGMTSQVLDLPSGSKAVSPSFCVTRGYLTARTMIRDVAGSEGVSYNVSYLGTSTWEKPKRTGLVHGDDSEWTPATAVNMRPYKVEGWQIVRLTLVPGGTASDFQLYNLYIDPYRR